MASNTVQSDSGVVLSFYKDDWVAFLCATDITTSIAAESLPVRTIGDGHWAKVTYQSLTWTITISGVLKINDVDDTNMSGLDLLTNMLNFDHVRARVSYYDDDSNIKSLQGYCKVDGLSLNASVGALVKNDITLTGNGELQYFDGIVPCDSLILTITPSNLTDADGNVDIAYTYSGSPYFVKYRLDDTGVWVTATIDAAITLLGTSIGTHSIEMIPICLNGYEADDSTSVSFVVTHGLSCTAVVTDITVTTLTATPVYTGTPTYYKYRFDSGAWITVLITASVSLAGLTTGTHTIEMVPICSNLVEGTGFTKSFSYTNPLNSTVNWTYSSFPGTNPYFQIFVNGTLYVNEVTSNSGSLIVAVGDIVKGVINSDQAAGGRAVSLNTADTTLVTTLDNQSGSSPVNLQYSFTANGDTYSITGTISP